MTSVIISTFLEILKSQMEDELNNSIPKGPFQFSVRVRAFNSGSIAKPNPSHFLVLVFNQPLQGARRKQVFAEIKLKTICGGSKMKKLIL